VKPIHIDAIEPADIFPPGFMRPGANEFKPHFRELGLDRQELIIPADIRIDPRNSGDRNAVGTKKRLGEFPGINTDFKQTKFPSLKQIVHQLLQEDITLFRKMPLHR